MSRYLAQLRSHAKAVRRAQGRPELACNRVANTSRTLLAGAVVWLNADVLLVLGLPRQALAPGLLHQNGALRVDWMVPGFCFEGNSKMMIHSGRRRSGMDPMAAAALEERL